MSIIWNILNISNDSLLGGRVGLSRYISERGSPKGLIKPMLVKMGKVVSVKYIFNAFWPKWV